MYPFARKQFGIILIMFVIPAAGCGYIDNETAACDDVCCHHDQSREELESDHASTPESQDASRVGPNGGQLIALGDDDFCAELVIDHDKAEATVNVLDRAGRKPVRTDQHEITLNVRANGRPHQIRLRSVETDGAPSQCFRGQSEALRGNCEFAGRLNILIQGKPYIGHVAHHFDDHKLVR